jgi:hypothetical protein
VRAEDVQRLVQEALAAGQATQQGQIPLQAQDSGADRPLERQDRDLEYERYSKCLERFQKMRPPSYGGEPDPVTTDGWVLSMEKILEALRCPAEYWVELAAYTFTHIAEHWWRSVRDQPDVRTDWEKFLVLFHRRFLPEPVLRQKEEEFNRLLQGSRTVWEYHAEFTTLARYAPHLLQDEPRLARKFRSGLRFEIVRRLGGAALDTIAQMVEFAQTVEIDLNLEKAAKPAADVKGKGKMPVSTSSKWRKRKSGGGFSAGNRTTLSGEAPPQKIRRDLRCYHCHEVGHVRSSCPLWRAQSLEQSTPSVPQGRPQTQYRPALPAPSSRSAHPQQQSQQHSRQSPGGQQRVQGRAYALTSDEAAASPTAVTGILPVCGFSAFVLIDSGSTHSIASVEFASRLVDVPRSFACEFVFSTPAGLDLCSRQCLIGCDVVVGKHSLPVDLIVLGITDFDVVLGMDWLEENFANVSFCSSQNNFLE